MFKGIKDKANKALGKEEKQPQQQQQQQQGYPQQQQGYPQQQQGYPQQQQGYPQQQQQGYPQQQQYPPQQQQGYPPQQQQQYPPQQQQQYPPQQQQQYQPVPQQQAPYSPQPIQPQQIQPNMQQPGMPPQQQLQQPQQQHPMQQQQQGGLQHGFAAIDSVKSIIINQQVKPLEIGCCDSELSYIVRPGDEYGEQANIQNTEPLFKAIENTECCERCVCGGSCRAFQLQVRNMRGQNEVFLKALRQCRYTFMCCDRPTITIYRMDNYQHSIVGTILHKYACCRSQFVIYDANGQIKWSIDGDYCQGGNLCRQCPCKACSQAKYMIRDAGGQNTTEITKKSKGCCKCCNGDQDTLHIIFPPKADFNDKILLMFVGLFMEYRYFDDNSICYTDGGMKKMY